MTTTEIEVRPARESETSDVLALIRAKAEFDGFLHTLKTDELNLRETLFSTPPKVKTLVALLDGALVGLVTYYDIYSSFLAKPGIWLDDLYVYEPYRGYGVGKALLVELCRIARSTGCARIDWVVSRDNDDARAFYEHLGAKIYEQVRHARLDENAIGLVLAKHA